MVHTSGGLDKLEVYRRLRVGEVWNHERGVLTVYALGPAGYTPVRASTVLPEFDLALLADCMRLPTQSAALAHLLAHLGT